MLGGRAEVSCAGAALRVRGAWSREPPGGTQRPGWCRHRGAACDAREMARERGCGTWAGASGRNGPTPSNLLNTPLRGRRTLGHCAPVPSPSIITDAL